MSTSIMINRQNKSRKPVKPLYPVGGYTKRIDQYGAVPAAVLAEERRLQQLEHRIERSRRWHLAQCEREQMKAAKQLRDLNEAKGRRVWDCLPAMSHTEYLYGGCLAVRVMDGDGLERGKGKDAADSHLQPQTTACHRTQAQTDLPNLLPNDHRPKKKTGLARKPRSWATLKRQFSDKVLSKKLPCIQDPRVSSSLDKSRASGGGRGTISGDVNTSIDQGVTLSAT